MPEIRWILLQARFEPEVQMELKMNWSSFTLSSSPISAVFTSGWLLFYFTLAIKQTTLNFPLHSWSSVGQESETAQQGWLFSVIQCLGPQLERLWGPGGWNHLQAYSLTWVEIAANGCWDLRCSCWPEHWHGSSPCGCLAGFHEQASQENQVNLIFLLCPTLRSHTVPLLPFSRFKRREHRPHCFIEGM